MGITQLVVLSIRYPTFDQNARKTEKHNSDFNTNWNWIRNFQL